MIFAIKAQFSGVQTELWEYGRDMPDNLALHNESALWGSISVILGTQPSTYWLLVGNKGTYYLGIMFSYSPLRSHYV